MRPEIAWAIEVLKREDRVMWYLRLFKNDDTRPTNDLKEKLEHYMGMTKNVPKMETYTFEKKTTVPNLIQELNMLESQGMEHYEKQSHLVPAQGKVILDLGSQWAWWDLRVGYSADEANAMGHCGNQAQKEGDTILSLRREKSDGVYEPHLTFVLNHGTLGEMKGKANEKPKKKYHKAIIKLLESPEIKHMMGGGYENKIQGHLNFSLDDLTEDEKNHLLKLKPQLDPMRMTSHKDMNKQGGISIPAHYGNMVSDRQGGLALIDEVDGGLKTLENYVDTALDAENFDKPSRFSIAGGYKKNVSNRLFISYLASVTEDENILQKIILFKPPKKKRLMPSMGRRPSQNSIAIKKIHDQKILLNIIDKADVSSIKEDAIQRLTEANVEKVAENYPDVRAYALQFVTNQDLLKRMYEEDSRREVQNVAVHNIDDQEFLYKVSEKEFDDDTNLQPQQVAIARIKDPKILIRILDKGDPKRTHYAWHSLPADDAIKYINNNEKIQLEEQLEKAIVHQLMASSPIRSSPKLCIMALRKIDSVSIRLEMLRWLDNSQKYQNAQSIFYLCARDQKIHTDVRIAAIAFLNGWNIDDHKDDIKNWIFDKKEDPDILIALISKIKKTRLGDDEISSGVTYNDTLTQLAYTTQHIKLKENIISNVRNPDLWIHAASDTSLPEEFRKNLVKKLSRHSIPWEKYKNLDSEMQTLILTTNQEIEFADNLSTQEHELMAENFIRNHFPRFRSRQSSYDYRIRSRSDKSLMDAVPSLLISKIAKKLTPEKVLSIPNRWLLDFYMSGLDMSGTAEEVKDTLMKSIALVLHDDDSDRMRVNKMTIKQKLGLTKTRKRKLPVK